MKDVSKYLTSGIIEDYCLGRLSRQETEEFEGYCKLYPELKTALNQSQKSIEQYLSNFEKTPLPNVMGNILEGIENSILLDQVSLNSKNKRLPKFIPISKFSKVQKWQQLTKELEPPEQFDIHYHELYQDTKNLLAVIWIKTGVPEEEHHDLLESIFLLNGECSGFLKGKKIDLKTGDFWQVPPHSKHSLKNSGSTPVKLILMRQSAI